MKASELITLLSEQIALEGDLEVVILEGEMSDPEPVGTVESVGADVTTYKWGKTIFIPYKERITNSKVIRLT